MNLKSRFCILFLGLFFLNTSLAGQTRILLETDFEGNVVRGSKQELIQEIRKGKSLRIGWQLDFNKDGEPDFDHWAPAEFITILNEDVFTQIRNINLQVPKLDIPQIDIIPTTTMWTAILGTNSLLKNRFVYGEFEFERDEDGNPIVTEQVEKELAKREVQTWKVATFWVIED